MVDSFIPQIRFKMCKNQWRKNKLSKLAKFNPKSTLPEKFKYVDLESVIGTDLISYREVSRENAPSRAQRLAQNGDIFYQTVRPYQKNNYLFDSDEKDYVFSTGYAQLRPLIDSAFLLARLQEESFVNKVLERCTGTSYPAINSKDLSKISVTIPQTTEEQSAIGSLFRTLDDLLDSYKDNLANYQSLKATMLSKMFPEAGQTVPEIRLDGFEGEWEEKYIGELADIVRGASPRPIQDPKWFDTNSEIGWLRISDVTSQNGRIYSLEQKISKLGQEKTRVLTEPHLLLSIAATVGKPVVNYVKTGVHDGFLIFMNPKFDREFMFQWLEMFREKWNRYGQPGSQVNLNRDIVKNQKILVPCMEEQQAIGAYFSNLDNLIVAHQEKISQLENLKKKLLQDMFI